jgi:phage shock protein PspC (stress-responsive transcriptional regulator)
MQPSTPKKFYRSRTDRMVTGLAGGIAQYFNIDSSIVRIVLVVLELGTAGILLLGYFIVAIIVPKEPLPPAK